MFLEQHDTDDVHPEYGRCEYREILAALAKDDINVISEQRTRGTDVRTYAGKVVKQIDSLLKSGVQPGQITVVGTSKGGYIAQYVSSLARNSDINYVFIGACSGGGVVSSNVGYRYYGNILSIYERSDAMGSCDGMVRYSGGVGKGVTRYKEVALNTGLRHGFLFKALPGWIEPTLAWAKGAYDAVGKQ